MINGRKCVAVAAAAAVVVAAIAWRVLRESEPRTIETPDY